MGAKLELSDKSYLAIRGEYFEDEDAVRGISIPVAPLAPLFNEDLELLSVTGTFGHQLTDNLLMRAELRYNEGDEDFSRGKIFPDDRSSAGFEDSEFMGILELVYAFD